MKKIIDIITKFIRIGRIDAGQVIFEFAIYHQMGDVHYLFEIWIVLFSKGIFIAFWRRNND